MDPDSKVLGCLKNPGWSTIESRDLLYVIVFIDLLLLLGVYDFIVDRLEIACFVWSRLQP